MAWLTRRRRHQADPSSCKSFLGLLQFNFLNTGKSSKQSLGSGAQSKNASKNSLLWRFRWNHDSLPRIQHLVMPQDQVVDGTNESHGGLVHTVTIKIGRQTSYPLWTWWHWYSLWRPFFALKSFCSTFLRISSSLIFAWLGCSLRASSIASFHMHCSALV